MLGVISHIVKNKFSLAFRIASTQEYLLTRKFVFPGARLGSSFPDILTLTSVFLFTLIILVRRLCPILTYILSSSRITLLQMPYVAFTRSNSILALISNWIYFSSPGFLTLWSGFNTHTTSREQILSSIIFFSSHKPSDDYASTPQATRRTKTLF